MKGIHVWVSGQVQGVGYRQTCRSVARSLDLTGWVRNLADGRVEVFAQGESDMVDQLVSWVWSGPSMAAVIGVESEIAPIDGTVTDFLIHPNVANTS